MFVLLYVQVGDIITVILDDLVPASFGCSSLEMSPSFRALAEELDDPKVRPSDTQLLQIERELEQIAGE